MKSSFIDYIILFNKTLKFIKIFKKLFKTYKTKMIINNFFILKQINSSQYIFKISITTLNFNKTYKLKKHLGKILFAIYYTYLILNAINSLYNLYQLFCTFC